MAKYLSYGGLEKVWGLAKNYFPTVKTATVNGTEVTWTTNTGVSAGNLATFAVDANGLVSLTGTTASTFAQASHAHGNVTSGGAITATAVTIANGDALTIVDSSASGKLVKSSITFDGSTSTKYLSQAGTWVSTINSHQDWGLVAAGSEGTANVTTATSDPYVNLVKGATPIFDSGVQLKGSNNVTVSANGGVITISGKANTVTGASLTTDRIILGNSNSTIKSSGKTIATTLGSDDTTIPTSKAVATAISNATSGLSGAMHFVGTSISTMTDGQTTNPTVIGVSEFSAGDVVVDATETEFVLGNEETPTWHKLGDANSYALSSVSITGTGALGGGGTLASNRTITHNTSGVTAGSAGPTADVSGANAISVPRITVDEYGHITALSSQTYTGVAAASNGRMTISANGGTAVNTLYTANVSSATNAINFVQGTGITTAVAAYSGSTAATVTITHADPGNGTDLAATNTDTTTYTNGGEYTVVTGVTITKDDKGHVTGLKEARQTIKSSIAQYSLPVAKYNTLGGIKPAYTTTGAATGYTAASNTSTPALNARTTTAGKYYAVEADKNGVAFVNVPWTDTSVTSSANHYTPSGTTAMTNTASGSGVSWSGAVVTSLTSDGKGHITGVKTSTLPSNPNVTTAAFVASSTSATSATAAGTTIANGSLYYILREGSTNTATLITGSGGTTVTKDGNGTNRIIITSPEVTEITEAEINTVCVI